MLWGFVSYVTYLAINNIRNDLRPPGSEKTPENGSKVNVNRAQTMICHRWQLCHDPAPVDIYEHIQWSKKES